MRRAAALVAVLTVALAALGPGAARAADAARGRALYVGEAALVARVAGQDFELAVQASRCVNCHGTPASNRGAAASAGAASLARSVSATAPALTADTLLRAQPRRGGPPSRYDAAALCTLLRRGVDPAHVMIQRTMPRYEISDADCQALWLHLSAPAPTR